MVFVLEAAAHLLRTAGVVNVVQDQNGLTVRHGAQISTRAQECRQVCRIYQAHSRGLNFDVWVEIWAEILFFW